MGKARDLLEGETAVIIALTKEKRSQRYIAQHLNRSKTAVQQCLARQKVKKGPQNRIRPLLVTPMTKRLLVRTALKEKWSAATLRSKLSLEVSVSTIQRYLQDAEFLVYRSLKTAPILSTEHKRKRLIWAREYVRIDASFWRRVYFTDEKRWCSGGPDGTPVYWSDKRIPAEIFSKRVRR